MPQGRVIRPGFGDLLLEQLPSMLLQMQRIQQQKEEERLRRLELTTKLREMHPEMYNQLLADPVVKERLVRELDPRPPIQRWMKKGKLPELPQPRDLTEDEVRARLRAQQELRLGDQAERSNELEIQKLQMDLRRAGTKEDALTRITKGDPQSLTLLDFIVGEVGETPQERAQAFVSKKWPEVADEVAQMTAGAGPRVEAARINEALQQYEQRYGKVDKAGMQYAEAVGKNDLNLIQKLPGLGLKTLAYRQYELQLKEAGAVASRFRQSQEESIGRATLQILDQHKGAIPIEDARKIASLIFAGKELPPELRKFDVSRAELMANVAMADAEKLRLELAEGKAGATGLRNMIEMHMKILAQEEGIPGDVKAMSRAQLEKLVPELDKRMSEALGIPPSPPKQPSTLRRFIDSVVGFTGEASRTSPQSGREAIREQLGVEVPEVPAQVTAGMQATRDAVRAAAKSPTAQFVMQSLQEVGKPASLLLQSFLAWSDLAAGPLTPKPRGAEAPKPPSAPTALTSDQRVHLQNVTREITTALDDPNVPLPVVQKFLDVLTLIEDVEKGKRSYSDLLQVNLGPDAK